MRKYIAILALALILCALVFRPHAAENLRNTPVVKVVKQWAPSVVNISTENIVLLRQDPIWGQYGPAFDDFFKQHSSVAVTAMKLKGIGSGVIVSDDGLIVTNMHVVQMASKVYVVFSDSSVVEAAITAGSTDDDVAILKIAPPKKLQPVKFAKDIIIGETVVSIGNPFGLENSVSAGIVSGTNRAFSYGDGRAVTGLIQTDASINIGSSGGALLNLEGDLVGVNLAVVQGAQSIGFAIPAQKIKELLKRYDEIKKTPTQIRIPAQ